MSSKTKSPQDRKPKAKKQIATAASWGSKKATGTFELELPSGNVVLLKRVDLPTLLASGAFPDQLMSIVSDKIETASGLKDTPKTIDPETVQNMIRDPKQLATLFEAIDKIVPMVVEQPVVKYHKQPVLDENSIAVVPEEFEIIPDAQRYTEAVYTDTVDLEDKMFIFQYTVGGTREVETFREELQSAVGDVPAS